MSLHKASLSLLVATALSSAATPMAWAEDTPERVRYMVVLKEGITPEQVPSVTGRLERDDGVRTVTTFTQGAQAGILVETSPANTLRLSRDRAVSAVLKVGDLATASWDIPADKLYKLPTGWAIPGSYVVHVAGGHLGSEADRTQRVPAWKDPNWKDRDANRIKAVEDVATSLIAQYGGRLISTGAPADASFSCAMTEVQARRMASDTQVRFVAESAYLFHDMR